MISKRNGLDLKFYDQCVELSFSEELLKLMLKGTNIYIEALKTQEEAINNFDIINEIEMAGNLFVKLLLCFGLCDKDKVRKVYVSLPEAAIFNDVCYSTEDFILNDSRISSQTKAEFFELSREVETTCRIGIAENVKEQDNNLKFSIKQISVGKLCLY